MKSIIAAALAASTLALAGCHSGGVATHIDPPLTPVPTTSSPAPTPAPTVTSAPTYTTPVTSSPTTTTSSPTASAPTLPDLYSTATIESPTSAPTAGALATGTSVSNPPLAVVMLIRPNDCAQSSYNQAHTAFCSRIAAFGSALNSLRNEINGAATWQGMTPGTSFLPLVVPAPDDGMPMPADGYKLDDYYNAALSATKQLSALSQSYNIAAAMSTINNTYVAQTNYLISNSISVDALTSTDITQSLASAPAQTVQFQDGTYAPSVEIINNAQVLQNPPTDPGQGVPMLLTDNAIYGTETDQAAYDKYIGTGSATEQQALISYAYPAMAGYVVIDSNGAQHAVWFRGVASAKDVQLSFAQMYPGLVIKPAQIALEYYPDDCFVSATSSAYPTVCSNMSNMRSALATAQSKLRAAYPNAVVSTVPMDMGGNGGGLYGIYDPSGNDQLSLFDVGAAQGVAGHYYTQSQLDQANSDLLTDAKSCGGWECITETQYQTVISNDLGGMSNTGTSLMPLSTPSMSLPDTNSVSPSSLAYDNIYQPQGATVNSSAYQTFIQQGTPSNPLDQFKGYEYPPIAKIQIVSQPTTSGGLTTAGRVYFLYYRQGAQSDVLSSLKSLLANPNL